MDKFDRKYFGLRQQETIHESSLTEVRETNSIDDLIDIVYNHQRASFRLNFSSYSNKLKEEDIAHYFYKNCYIPNDLYTGHDGHKITTKKFVKYLFGNDIKGKNNKIHFLLGEVGSGKTSLINYIITNCLPKSVREGKLLFVRIDLNLEDFEEDIDVKNVLKKLLKKLKRIIKKNPEIYPKEELWSKIKKCSRKFKNDYETQFAEIVKLIRSDRHLMIIFDNLDSIVHHNDRGAFKKFENKKLKEIRKIAFEFVNKFHSDNGAFSDLGAFVLFVMRNSTYGRINNFAKHSGSTKKFVNNTNCHTIIKQGWKEVVTTRNSLFQYAINSYDVIDDEDKEMLERFKEMMEKGKENFPLALKSINNLANKQLRDLVESEYC